MIASLQREIDELQENKQTKNVTRQLSFKIKTLKLLQKQISDDEDVDKSEQQIR